MNIYQKSALIGMYRSGCTLEEMSKAFDISVHYVSMIIKHYLEGKELEDSVVKGK